MKTENDYYIDAVELSQRIDRDYKCFAFCCAQVSGARTAALAEDCKTSPSSIEKYRNAYALKTRFEIDYKSERVTKLWDSASMSLWRKAAELESSLNLSLEMIWDYLQTASEEGMSRDTFAAHVDTKENKTPQWIRRLKSFIRILSPIKNDYRSEMPAGVRARFDEALNEFIEKIQEIAEAEAVIPR